MRSKWRQCKGFRNRSRLSVLRFEWRDRDSNAGKSISLFESQKIQNFIITQSLKSQKDVNRDSHIASSLIAQSYFFEKVRCLILASSHRKLRGHIEFLKFDITMKKVNKFKFVYNLKVSTDSRKVEYQTSLSISAFRQKISAL